MSISFLTEKEIEQVKSVINQILQTTSFNVVLEDNLLIRVHNKRSSIFLVNKTDSKYIRILNKKNNLAKCKPIFLKINLGFWIRNNFKIGIESLSFLNQYCEFPVILPSKKLATKFIYGNNVSFPLKGNLSPENKYSNGTTVIVSSKNHVPLGYAIIRTDEKRIYLKNIIDIGIYLRSEKTAF